jgi:hypothetical protein
MTSSKAQAEALQRLFKLHLIREIEANREAARTTNLVTAHY